MSLESLESVFAQAQPLAERVCLHVMGEPLNHPQFKDCVVLAENQGVQLEITTNGTLLSESAVSALLNPAVVQVNFSLQSFVDNFPKASPQSYFRKVIGFTKKALIERPELYINFRFWNLEDEMMKNEVNEFFLKTVEEEFSIVINRNVDPAFRKSKKVSGRLYLHFDSRFEWPQKNQPMRSQNGTCHGTRSHVAIHADGTVVPCCLDKEASIVLGNVFESELTEILNSNRLLKMKTGFENFELVEHLCQRCTFRERFDKSGESFS